jgi:hypothetical protein
MTPADTRRLADALRRWEADLLDFGLELELDDAAMITLSRWWRGQLGRLVDEHPVLAEALGELDQNPSRQAGG